MRAHIHTKKQGSFLAEKKGELFFFPLKFANTEFAVSKQGKLFEMERVAR